MRCAVFQHRCPCRRLLARFRHLQSWHAFAANVGRDVAHDRESFVDCDHPDEALLARYMAYGGLPPVVEQGEVQALAKTVLSGIYDTVLVKDIASTSRCATSRCPRT